MAVNRQQAAWTRRKFLAAMGATAGGALLGGCGGGGGQAGGGNGGGGGGNGGELAGEVSWAMWSGSPEETEVWQTIADRVTEVHPNITVALDASDTFDAYFDTLLTRLAGNTAPDIISMQSLRMPSFAPRGAFAPLNERVQDEGFNYDDFFDVIQEGLSFNGDIYALAYDLGPHLLFYNMAMFEEAGIPFPSPTEPMSWEQFREIAEAFTRPDQNQWGFTSGADFGATIPWIWSAGGDYMNEMKSECTMDSDASLEGLDFRFGLIRDGLTVPVTDLANTTAGAEDFQSGAAAMLQDGPWQVVNLRANADFDFDIAPLPAGPAGMVTTVAGSGFGLSATAAQPDVAWEALKVIASPESHRLLTEAGRGYPGRQSATEFFAVEGRSPQNVEVVEQILTGDTGEVRPTATTTTWQEIEIMLERQFNPLFIDGQNVESVIRNTIVPEFNALLEEHQAFLDSLEGQ